MPSATTGVRRGRSRPLPPLWLRSAAPLALLGLWQLVAEVGGWDPRLISSPAEVARTLAQLAGDGRLVDNLLPSLVRAATGLLLGGLAGGLLAVVSAFWFWGEAAVDLSVQILRSVPFVALTSLYIVWFGFGELPKVLLIATACFFPIYVNVFAGIRSVDGRLVEMARTAGLSTYRVIRHVVLPGATSSALVGLRYALTTSLLALVIAETINAESGIGYLMEQARRYLDTPVIFACLFVYCLLGVAADVLVRSLTGLALRWEKGLAAR